MSKLSVKDSLDLAQALLLIAIIVCFSTAVLCGISYARDKGTIIESLDEVGEIFMSSKESVVEMGEVLTTKYLELLTVIDKNTKNINYLIHQRNIDREKIAKLEAQLQLLLCEEEKGK